MRILVADDTVNIRMLLTACLQADGHEVQTAANGEEAQNLLLQETFGLAFLDIKMPLLSGTQVLKNIRDQGIQTPIIIITAFATVKNAIDCTRYGAVAYLQKPFTATKVKAVIAELQTQPQVIGSTKKTESAATPSEREAPDAELTKLLNRLPAESQNAELYILIAKCHERNGRLDEASRFFRCAEFFSANADHSSAKPIAHANLCEDCSHHK